MKNGNFLQKFVLLNQKGLVHVSQKKFKISWINLYKSYSNHKYDIQSSRVC